MSDSVKTAEALQKSYAELRKQIGRVIVGQDRTVELVLTALFCNGHCVLVGVPGLAKTLLVQSIARALELDFRRVQFTPDLMPSDILGAEVMDAQRNFRFVQGPIFTNILLADEINRTPPKTQAALLEAMAERSVTVAGQHQGLPKPFLVLATQNPIEQEGTYPLPEAQLDRFLFEIRLDYPSFDEEVQILTQTTGGKAEEIQPVLNAEQILKYQALIREVPIAQNVVEYAVSLVHRTRPNGEKTAQATKDYLEWGAGPRAGQALVLGAKCHALLHGKFSPDIEDVQAIALPVLQHRLLRNFKAEAEGVSVEKIVAELL